MLPALAGLFEMRESALIALADDFHQLADFATETGKLFDIILR